MDKDQALQAQADYESLQAFFGTHMGERLIEKLDEIDKAAVDKAMRGSTPENNNTYMESRGKVIAVKQVKSLFDDVDSEHREANAILGSQINVSDPADTSAPNVEKESEETQEGGGPASPETE